MQIKENNKMRERVIAVLEKALPGVDVEASEYLVDDGMIDSLGIVNIIAELSLEFGINIPFEELEADNFNSVDNMVKLVEKLL